MATSISTIQVRLYRVVWLRDLQQMGLRRVVHVCGILRLWFSRGQPTTPLKAKTKRLDRVRQVREERPFKNENAAIESPLFFPSSYIYNLNSLAGRRNREETGPGKLTPTVKSLSHVIIQYSSYLKTLLREEKTKKLFLVSAPPLSLCGHGQNEVA